MSATISDLFAFHRNDGLAIGAPDRPWLTYAGLRDLVSHTVTALHAAGIGRGDRVAIVLPNGPEMAAAFVAVSQAAVTAPLNPGYRLEEFAFYLSDLKAKAIVLAEGYDGPAHDAAEAAGL
ncbi:MAG: AMP-binding protein, partial [Cereibacter changlensis]